MDHARYETLELAYDGDLAILTLNRPELLNRIDVPCHHELIRAFRELAENRNIRAVLWRAEGKVFSAGGDLSALLPQHDDPKKRQEMLQQAIDIIHMLIAVHVPVVVALHGSAFGLSANLVLLSDIVVSTPGAKICDPHVRIGLVAADGGIVAWPAAMGMPRAKYHLLTGEPIDAEDAYQLGMISKLVGAPDECRQEAERIARLIAALPPAAVQGTKRTFNAALRARANEVLETGLAYGQSVIMGDDMLEAVAAFKEKRQGIYTGR